MFAAAAESSQPLVGPADSLEASLKHGRVDVAERSKSPEEKNRLASAVLYILVVVASYFVAATYVSPQLQQADKPPYNIPDGSAYETPTLNGGGYCFTALYGGPACESYNGAAATAFARPHPAWR